MHSRRAFIASLGALALAPDALLAEEPKQTVAPRVAEIAEQLRTYPEIAEVLSYPHPAATHALIHWEWLHFKETLAETDLPMVEACQAEVKAAMLRAMEDTRVLLKSLLTEGMVQGNERNYLQTYGGIVRSAVEGQMTIAVPFSISDIRPSPEELRRGMKDPKYLERIVPQPVYVVRPDGTLAERRTLHVSAQGRAGAPYILHHTQGLTLTAAEDPAIDRKAADAEWSGDPATYERWVMTERNAHFVELAGQSREAISHMLCGYRHDLRSEATRQGISLVVVSPHTVAKHRKAAS